MLKKVNAWMTGAYLKGKMAAEDFKNDERGLSGVVVAVLLILVAVLAIVALWGSLSGWLVDMWDRITGAQGSGAIKGSQKLG